MDSEKHEFHDTKEDAIEVITQGGVLKVAAVNRVWTPSAKVFLFVGIALSSYVYSLDGTSTYLYQSFATSSFEEHSLLSAIAVAQSIILAVLKPPSAKVADVFGRAEAFTISVCLYVVGYIIIASSNTVNTYAGGAIIYSAGSASLQILLQIVIADVTTARLRTFVSALVSLPFFINAFVGANIGAQVNAGAGWRWGYGMFAIIIPAAVAPIIVVLFWAQIKAKRNGTVATNYNDSKEDELVRKDDRSLLVRSWDHITSLDLFGLLLFAAGWSMFLIPLTLTNNSTLTWNSSKPIGLIVGGAVILGLFIFWEGKMARMPVVPFHFFKNKTFVAACIINMFDFISFYLQYTYQYSFIYVTHSGWSAVDQNYFAYTQTLSLTFFGIAAGVYAFYTRRLKWLLVFGLVVRLVSVGAMIKTKGAHGSTAGLVLTQVFQGFGGGIAAVLTQTAAQVTAPHQSVAAITAVVLLFAEIGNAIGTAIAGAIWRNYMPGQLTNELSGLLNATEIASIYGSITTAASYPEGSPIYEGVITAYDTVMVKLLIAATCLAVIPVLAALMVENIYLPDVQNLVEDDSHLIDRTVGAKAVEAHA